MALLIVLIIVVAAAVAYKISKKIPAIKEQIESVAEKIEPSITEVETVLEQAAKAAPKNKVISEAKATTKQVKEVVKTAAPKKTSKKK